MKKAPPTFRQKIFFIVLGLFLSLALLEAGLRLAGGAFLLVQEFRNQKSLVEGNELRVLCIGESTTALGGANAYPRQLERILNARQGIWPDENTRINFSVINKGVPAIETNQILARLPGYLKQYKPQIVVAMIGINDWLDPGQYDLVVERSAFESLRIFKLLKLFKAHLEGKKADLARAKLEKKLSSLRDEVELSPSADNLIKLAGLYRAANFPQKEGELLSRLLSREPHNPQGLLMMGVHYKRLGDCQQAIIFLDQGLKVSPSPAVARQFYNEIAECFKLLGQYDRAEEHYKKMIEVYGAQEGAFGNLADVYLEQGKYDLARQALERQLIVDPKSLPSYGKLAHCYRLEGRLDLAGNLLQRAFKIAPDDPEILIERGIVLFEQQRWNEARDVFEKVLKDNSENLKGFNERVYGYLLKIYESQGDSPGVRKVTAELKRLKTATAHPVTERNYRKIRSLLDREGIPLVAVQYPMRDVAIVKQMLSGETGIVFVDNRSTFEKAVGERGFDYYFTDRFAGDFGHCTPEGNRLLAENIARAILKIVPADLAHH